MALTPAAARAKRPSIDFIVDAFWPGGHRKSRCLRVCVNHRGRSAEFCQSMPLLVVKGRLMEDGGGVRRVERLGVG